MFALEVVWSRKPTIKESLREAPHGVVAEVDVFERDVAGGEYLGRQQLPPDIPLAELLWGSARSD